MTSKLRLATSNGKKPTPSTATKASLTAKAQQLLDQEFIPRYVHATPPNPIFNYVSALHFKWRGNSFYFCATYNCPSPDTFVSSFETKFARIEYISNERYNLSYMRHTEKWFEIEFDLTMDQCLREIRENELFTP